MTSGSATFSYLSILYSIKQLFYNHNNRTNTFNRAMLQTQNNLQTTITLNVHMALPHQCMDVLIS